jgi:cytidine diphosphoramidate kinase
VSGRVFWLTGLSGAGKTTVGALLRDRLREAGLQPILLDGDRLRTVLAPEAGHTPEERRQLAFAYARLCRELAGQGFIVICATISMFHDVREWNAVNIFGYLEIYLRVPLAERMARDPKRLYHATTPNMVGWDDDFEEPRRPDMVINNHGSVAPTDVVDLIFERFAESLQTSIRSTGSPASLDRNI